MLQGKQMLRNTDSNHLTLPLREKKKRNRNAHSVVSLHSPAGKVTHRTMAD